MTSVFQSFVVYVPAPVTDDSTSWSALYGQIIANLALDWSADAVSADILNAPKGLKAQYEPPPPILDAAAYNAGQRVVRKLTGAVKATNYATDLSAIQDNLRVTTQPQGSQGHNWKPVWIPT